MNLSPRLRCIADMVSGVKVMADIGSDHAYLPITLLRENQIERAIITDVAKNPIQIARQNVAENLLEDFCSIRMGSGLAPLKVGEAGAIVIAGMGGNLISDILKDGAEVAKKADFLVLQAMQHTTHLREFLNTNSYKIIEERVVFDSGKYYEIIKVLSGEQRRFSKLELEIGHAMVKDDIYFDFLDKKSKQYKKIIEARKNSKSNADLDEYKEVLAGIATEVLEKTNAHNSRLG